MGNNTQDLSKMPSHEWPDLEGIAREGARKILQQALELEVKEHLEKYKDMKGEGSRRAVVRNGYLPERTIVTGIGEISVRQPRVNDKALENTDNPRFSSKILPRYLRRIASVDNLIPALYLKGVSTGDFAQALEAILGKDVKGLSATNVVRLKRTWEADYDNWRGRDMSGKQYVYFWADGIYFNVRLDHERSCILVIMGADKDGNKELVAVSDGYRESKLSWIEMLRDLKDRGLANGPKIAIADGALGFWAAMEEEFPQCRRQRCWVHKTANILDKLPKSVQSKAKSQIHEMYMAESKENAEKAFNQFVNNYEQKFPKAVSCLVDGREDLFSFYDFPAEHWPHIRTTNPIESTFATVRLRTKRTKGCGSRKATLTMVFKLTMEAQKTWRKLKGYQLIQKVLDGIVFKDGLCEAA